MKSVSAPFLDALKNDYALRAVPRAIVDWNLNRYVSVTASNIIDEQDFGYDIELFPIESIVDVERPRPSKGINKARIGTGTVSSDYFENDGNGRYYVCDIEDVYKYWTSPNRSDGSGNISDCAPRIIYGSLVDTNKIVINTENSWATAETFNIQTTVNGTTWTTIANQTDIGNTWKSSGEIILYWDGDSWGLGPRVDDSDGFPITTQIIGIRISVTTLEGGYKTVGTLVPTTYRIPASLSTQEYLTDGSLSHFDLIEISARLEADLSNHIIGWNDRAEMSEIDTLYPIGTITSNEATLELTNIYLDNLSVGLFSRDNPDAGILWSDYLEPNAEVSISIDYYDEADDYLGNVQQFVGYTDGWTGQDSDTVSVSLLDYSKFFNSVNVPAAMWEDLTVPQIVWRILDSVGFTNYQVDRDADVVTEHVIPVFYTTGEETVWTVLDELAKASQTAIYFDCVGVLQVKTRDFAFSPDDAAVWHFTSVTDSGYLPNIIEANQDVEYEPNYFKIIYQKTNWSDWNRGQPSLQIVWEPEDTQVLRSSPLIRSMNSEADRFWMGTSIAALWPYSGTVNIQGEIITFDAKEFTYFTGETASVSNTVWVAGADEMRDKANLTPPGYDYKNHLTGSFRITERGAWNSEARAHSVDATGYVVHGRVGHTHYSSGVAGFTHLKGQSRVELSAPSRVLDEQDWVIASQNSGGNYYHYGTKFKFAPNGGTDQKAGIVICEQGAGNGGYFIELCPSNKLNDVSLATRKELHVYARDSSGNTKIVETVGMRRVNIAEGIDYELDVYHVFGATQRIAVWLDGKQICNLTVPEDSELAATGKFGMFIRGKSTARFEYLYAIGRDEAEPADEFGFLDKVARAYTGSQWDREWVHRWYTERRRIRKTWRKEKLRWDSQFFDEFGPFVHEIREYDIQFEPSPVLHSRIYSTNDWGAAVLEYSGNPNGAKFVVANTSRINSVVHGQDSLSFAGTDQTVEQYLYVFGRALVVDESEEIVSKNDAQIRRRGRIESELTSPWIQSRQMANDLSDWISSHWTYGNSNITISAMGNPLIEIGDVVTVNHPDKFIDGEFFVVGIQTSWSDGVSSEFNLRRRS